jgi:hypothetical protein
MKKKITTFAAFHGSGWKKRTASSLEEKKEGVYWSSWQTNSEYNQLKAVLLFSPEKEISNLKNPNRVQHLKKIDSSKIGL